MPRTSSSTTDTVEDFGAVEDRFSELDAYTASFLTVRETADLAPMLASLPSGRCECPHWGYVLEGRAVVRYADHEETLEAGDAYYMSPGHVPLIEAGSRLVMFSPTDQLAATDAAIKAALGSQAV